MRNPEKTTDGIKLALDEYINVDGFTFAQASAKIIEEEWQDINENDVIKYSFLISLAHEGVERKELPDFLYEKLDFNFNTFFETENAQFNQLKQNYEVYRTKINEKNYSIIETSVSTKSRIEYILNQKT